MTGFGKATLELSGKTMNIEIRSVNSKNFDFFLRVPPHFREKEPEIRKQVQNLLERGKIELTLSENQADEGTSVKINEIALKKHFEAMKNVAWEMGMEASPDFFAAILRIPDVLITAENELNEKEWELISKALEEACLALDAFRAQEGAALRLDIEDRIANIRNYQEEILPFEESRIDVLRSRFEKDLTSLMDFTKIDRNRLEQEIIFYLEKLDITEEKVRLLQHLDYFIETLDENGSQGKKLNFISQEIGRELNTLGSKANHAQIQRLVVMMKDELEKIKEQMLNIL